MTMSNQWNRLKSLPVARKMAVTAVAMTMFASTAGTIFAAAGPERQLAGISIFAPGSAVTRRFGNPSRILVGGASATGTGAAGGGGGYPGGGGGGGYPGGGGGYPGGGGGGYPGGGGGYPGGGGGGYPGGNSAGLLPGFGGYPGGSGGGGGYPGGGGGGYPGGSGGGGGAAGGGAAPAQSVVTLVYDRPLGGSLEFTISPDKRVVQIRETGYSGAYGTARAVKLGATYAQVVARYGYPEDTTIAGPLVNIDYKDTLHCGFQFLDQKLVGIIIAAPD